MNSQIKAAVELHDFFVRERVQYAIMGGIAVQWWGEPRFTRDVDVTILVDGKKEKDVLKKILSYFSPRLPNALDFALKNRVCLVRNKAGIEIDISLGLPGYEEQCINRSMEYRIEKKNVVRICTAEDLIIHKAIAGRPQDLSDIQGIIIRQGKKLNVRYIRKWLREFALLLEKREILKRFDEPWKTMRHSS